MSEQWGPWIEHDGKGCPCVGAWVQGVFDVPTNIPVGFRDRMGVVMIAPDTFEGIATDGDSWRWDIRCYRVIRYRICRFSAEADLAALAANPRRAKVPVDA